MKINDPLTVAEILRCHDLYENALASNDVETLSRLFWEAPEVVRYGIRENLYGSEQIRSYRQNQPKIDLARTITRLEIIAFGEDTGIINLEFQHTVSSVEHQGRQTQLWRRFVDGWKIATAHVSLLPEQISYVHKASAEIGLPLDLAYVDAVSEDFHRTAVLAQFLMEYPLDQKVETAAVFLP